jgi:hypothetical protein
VIFKSLELFAQDFRQKNGLSLSEPIKVKSLLQKLNVLTIYKPLSSRFSGMFDKKGNTEEYSAEIFASYLLLPESGIWEMIPENERTRNRLSIETVIAIEQYFGCSHSALLYRLLNMGLINQEQKDEFSFNVISNARKLGYNISLYEKGNENEVVGDYGVLAHKAMEEGLVSESSYLTLLQDLGVDISKFDDDKPNGDF